MGTEGDFTNFLICVEAISPGGATALQNDVIATLSVDMNGKAGVSGIYMYYIRISPSHLNDIFFSITDVADIQFQVSNEITLPAANPSGCATFNIVNDDLVEGDHTLIFVIDSLSSTDGIMINMMMNTHPFTIMDNNGKELKYMHQYKIWTGACMKVTFIHAPVHILV